MVVIILLPCEALRATHYAQSCGIVAINGEGGDGHYINSQNEKHFL